MGYYQRIIVCKIWHKKASWDLVDAMKKNRVDLEKIDAKLLPEELQKKSSKEIKEYVAKKSEERKTIQDKITELDTKRRKFMPEKNLETSQKAVLDNVMIQAIKKQAISKNYSW